MDTTRSRLIPLEKGFSQYMLSMPWVPAARTASGDTDPNLDLTPDTAKLTQMGLRDFAQVVQTYRDKQFNGVRKPTTKPREYAAANHLAFVDFDDPRLYQAGQRFTHKDIRQAIYALLTNYSATPVRLPSRTKPCSRASAT